MGSYNELEVMTPDGSSILIQFKFGHVRQHVYHVGDVVFPNLTEEIEPGRVEVDGIAKAGDGSLHFYKIIFVDGSIEGYEEINEREADEISRLRSNLKARKAGFRV